MLDELASNAGHYVRASPWLALLAVFAGGALTASNPCVLATVPLTVSFVAGRAENRLGVLRAFSRALIENRNATRLLGALRRGAGFVVVLVGVYFAARGLE